MSATVSHCLRCAVLFMAITGALCGHTVDYDGVWNETDMSVNVVLLGSVSVLVKHILVESSILQWKNHRESFVADVRSATADDSSNIFVFLYGWNVTDYNETGTPTAYSNLSLRVRVFSNATCPYFDLQSIPVTGNTTITPVPSPAPPPPPSNTMRRLLAPSTTHDVCTYIRDSDFSTGLYTEALMYIYTDAHVDVITHVEIIDSVISVSYIDNFFIMPALRTVGTLSTGIDQSIANGPCASGKWSDDGNACPGATDGINWRYYLQTEACLWWHSSTKNWQQAHNTCKNMGGGRKLALPANALQREHWSWRNNNYWAGARRAAEDVEFWNSYRSHPDTSNTVDAPGNWDTSAEGLWDTGQPSGTHTSFGQSTQQEECLQIKANKRWNDKVCSDGNSFYCYVPHSCKICGSGACLRWQSRRACTATQDSICEGCTNAVCQAGENPNHSGGCTCTSCVAGSTYKSEAGSLPCTACSTTACNAWHSRSECTTTSNLACTPCTNTCGVGHTPATAGGCNCNPCTAGTYKAQAGNGLCTACESGKYQNTAGASNCITCPQLAISVSPRTSSANCICPSGALLSTDESACYCPAGHSRVDSVVGGVAILACTACSGGQYSLEGWSECITGCANNSVLVVMENGVDTMCRFCALGKLRSSSGVCEWSACMDTVRYRTSITMWRDEIPQMTTDGSLSLDVMLHRIKMDGPRALAYLYPCVCRYPFKSMPVYQQDIFRCEMCESGTFNLAVLYLDNLDSPGTDPLYPVVAPFGGITNGMPSVYTFGHSTCSTPCFPGSYAEAASPGVGLRHEELSTYMRTSGATGSPLQSCQQCPEGSVQSLMGQTQCVWCKDSVASADRTTCVGCGVGRRTELTTVGVRNIMLCRDCDAGTYNANDGASTCHACRSGQYSNQGESVCTLCSKCADGNFGHGCLAGPGVCRPCSTGMCTNDAMTRIACINREGFPGRDSACAYKEFLTRTPLCQSDVTGLNRGAGLGGYDFESVFGADETKLDFACSRVCDSRSQNAAGDYGTNDTMHCEGPFACNRMACTMQTSSDVTDVNDYMVPRACPVILAEHEKTDPNRNRVAVNDKRGVACQKCSECGGDNNRGLVDWGRGCAQECSMIECDNGNIYDWTDNICKSCASLANVSLCSSLDRELEGLHSTEVSGNRPKVIFAACVEKQAGAVGRNDITYGTCDSCRDEVVLCAAGHYHADCGDGGCVPCMPRQDLVFDSGQSFWNFKRKVPLYCQISACLSGLTGVEDNGNLCKRGCSATVCDSELEITLPCVIPHDVRCVSRADQRLFEQVATGSSPVHANLFENPSSGLHQFSSFENIMINVASHTDDLHQCVWNVVDIRDNDMNPGGVAHTFFKPAAVYAHAISRMGSKFCHRWTPKHGVEYPVTPLQNTVSFDSGAIFPRRIMINTTARAVDYRYSGLGMDHVAHIRQTTRFTAHSMYTGDFFLNMDVFASTGARLSVFIPTDRGIQQQTWIRRFELSFLVVDTTLSPSEGLVVRADTESQNIINESLFTLSVSGVYRYTFRQTHSAVPMVARASLQIFSYTVPDELAVASRQPLGISDYEPRAVSSGLESVFPEMRYARQGVIDRPVDEFYVRKIHKGTGSPAWKPLTYHADPGNADCNMFVSHHDRIDCVSLESGVYNRVSLALPEASGSITGCVIFLSASDQHHTERRLALVTTLHARDGVRMRAMEVSSGGIHSDRVINNMNGGTVAMAGYSYGGADALWVLQRQTDIKITYNVQRYNVNGSAPLIGVLNRAHDSRDILRQALQGMSFSAGDAGVRHTLVVSREGNAFVMIEFPGTDYFVMQVYAGEVLHELSGEYSYDIGAHEHVYWVSEDRVVLSGDVHTHVVEFHAGIISLTRIQSSLGSGMMTMYQSSYVFLDSAVACIYSYLRMQFIGRDASRVGYFAYWNGTEAVGGSRRNVNEFPQISHQAVVSGSIGGETVAVRNSTDVGVLTRRSPDGRVSDIVFFDNMSSSCDGDDSTTGFSKLCDFRQIAYDNDAVYLPVLLGVTWKSAWLTGSVDYDEFPEDDSDIGQADFAGTDNPAVYKSAYHSLITNAMTARAGSATWGVSLAANNGPHAGFADPGGARAYCSEQCDVVDCMFFDIQYNARLQTSSCFVGKNSYIPLASKCWDTTSNAESETTTSTHRRCIHTPPRLKIHIVIPQEPAHSLFFLEVEATMQCNASMQLGVVIIREDPPGSCSSSLNVFMQMTVDPLRRSVSSVTVRKRESSDGLHTHTQVTTYDNLHRAHSLYISGGVRLTRFHRTARFTRAVVHAQTFPVGREWTLVRQMYTGDLVRMNTGRAVNITIPATARGRGMHTVGIDALQLVVCLTDGLAVLRALPAAPLQSVLYTSVYMPRAAELAAVGLQHALSGSNVQDWERLHVTVGLRSTPGMLACRYRIGLAPAAGDGSPQPVTSSVRELGCVVTLDATGAGGCLLEIPTALGLANEFNLIGLYASVDTEPERCQWPETDLFTVNLHPLAMQYSCVSTHFWSHTRQACVSCEVELGSQLSGHCGPGKFVQGCDELASSDENSMLCSDCTLAADLHATHFTWTAGGAPCQWQCVDGMYRHNNTCLVCTEERRDTCRDVVGQRWRACTLLDAETCTPCPRIVKGIYSALEQYVAGAECATACLSGHYNHTNPDTNIHTCRPCTSITMLSLGLDAQAAGPRDWHRFEACTATRDTTPRSCELAPVPSASYSADATTEGENCPFVCHSGFHRVGEQCIPCLILAADGSSLPPHAYTVTSLNCDFTCNATALYFKRPPGGTCVFCNTSTCGVGHYLTGIGCGECMPCAHTKTPDWIFASAGRLDDAVSCQERCPFGMFADFETCVPHTSISCDYTRQYKLAGTHVMDAMCLPCSSCHGRNLTRQCSQHEDATCSDCLDANAGAVWSGSNCSLSCMQGHILTSSLQCELCPSACGPGFRRPAVPDNCTHCLACPAIPAHAEFRQACAWECSPGYEGNFTDTSARCQHKTVRTPPRPSRAKLSVRCGPRQMLSKDYTCVECTSAETGIVTPDPAQQGLTWNWSAFGTACSWDCATDHFYYERSRTAVFCYTWEQYTRHTLQLAGQLPESMPLQPLREQVVQIHAIQLHEWVVTLGAVVALILILMATCM